MKRKIPEIFIVLLALTAFGWWSFYNPTKDFQTNLAGQDGRPDIASRSRDEVKIGEFFERSNGKAQPTVDQWPSFRGPDKDNIYNGTYRIRDNWSDEYPKKLWQMELGEGHAAPAVLNGKAFILDYDEERKADALKCIALHTGEVIWSRWYNVPVKRNHGLSRTIPAVTEKFVVSMGPKCHVMCVDTETGIFRWGLDLVKNFGAEVPLWYTGQCPIIVDDVAILAVGGKSLLMGVDCNTGDIVWETPNPDGWKMSHSSVQPFTYQNVKMYIYTAVGGIVGVAADGPDVGKILWKTDAFNHSVIAPTPVPMPDGKIYVTAGYGAGSIMLQLVKNANSFEVRTIRKLKANEGMASEQQTPLYYQNHLISIMPKDGGEYRNQLVCYNPSDHSKIVWSSGKTHRFGLGPYMLIGDKMLLLNDNGELHLIKASAENYEHIAEAKVLDGHDAWGPFAFVDGLLLLRDSKNLVCLDFR